MGNTKKGGNSSSTEDEDIEEIDEELDEDEDIEEEEDNSEEDESEEDDDEGDDDEDLTEEELRAKLKKTKQIAKNQKIRAEKAEAKAKEKKGTPQKKVSTKKQSDLSNGDMYTLMKADVHEDDIDEIRDYAILKKISIKEALATNFIKSLLSDKNEERETAEATHTGSSRKTNGRKTSSKILEDAAEGNLPDDPADLAQARIDKKRADRQQQKR